MIVSLLMLGLSGCLIHNTKNEVVSEDLDKIEEIKEKIQGTKYYIDPVFLEKCKLPRKYKSGNLVEFQKTHEDNLSNHYKCITLHNGLVEIIKTISSDSTKP